MSKFFQRRDLDKTFFKVLFSMLMVFVLLISVASPSHAVVGVTSILIPSVIAALESWGISTAADGLDGDEIAEWFHDKLTDWSTYAGIALENIVTGIKMTPLGQVLLNPFALNAVRLFADWFVQQNGLTAGGSSVQVISGGLTFNGYPVSTELYLVGSGYYDYRVVAETGGYLFVTYNGSTGYWYANLITMTYGKRAIVEAVHNGIVEGRSSFGAGIASGIGYYNDSYSFSNIVLTEPSVVSFTAQEVLSGSSGPAISAGSMDLVPSLEMSVPSATDVQDKDLLINTSLDVGADAAAWYEGVMNKVAANDFTATAAITQAGTITADQVIPQEGITDVDGTVSWPEVTSPIGVSGLDEIFPFCIPFDVYHFFQALAADPVAPSFEIPFVIPNIVDYTFELDLSDFDQVAQILRTVELLAFCVGLAFVTRSFFIRG